MAGGAAELAGVEQQSLRSERPVQPKINYRPEIDGLRAFAVVAVIINHFNKDLLPGGYLGVDIFFVISGYVITASLAGRKSLNFGDFLSGFYVRRIKRLLPALVVFTLTVAVLLTLFNPEPQGPLGIGIRALFGFSNIALYQSSVNYFAQTTELNPFMHTWSLGVEEQFYLLFPFLIWFSGFGRQTKNGARHLFLWIGSLTLASLTAFIYLYQANQPAAYFLMPPRFWEMAAGCLIYIGFQKRAKVEQALEKVPPFLVVAGMVGVMVLAKEAVPATLSMVILSAVLIACLKRGTGAFELFTNKHVVYLGLISYSLYIWHWGVLSISRYSIGIHWWSVPFQVALILLLSILSFTYVEQPFRAAKTFVPQRYVVILLGLLVSFGSALVLKMLMKAGPGLYQARLPTHQETMTYGRSVDATIDGEKCHIFTPDSPMNKKWAGPLPVKECSTFVNAQTPRIFFVGNSYAAHLIAMQKAIHRQGIANTINFSFGWCPFLGDVSYKRCNEFGDGQLRMLRYVKDTIIPGDVVVVSNRFPFREADNPGTWLSASAKERLIDFNRYLSARGASLVVFGPSPEFAHFDPELCRPTWFRPFVNADCSTPRKELMAARREDSMKLQALEQAGVKIYNPMKVLCPGDQCTRFDSRGKRLYFDNQHFNDYAAGEVVFADFVNFLRTNRLLSVSRP